MAKKKTKKRNYKYTAKNADKHELYQLSVQDPAHEIAFISRVFKKGRDRVPLTLREDFCGTALMCGHWVGSKKERRALGIDLDEATLAWGIERNLSAIGEPGQRVQLLQQDVRDKVPGKFDVAVAFNFSYWVFKQRDDMVGYFKGVRRSLERDGMFFLDAYGGYEAQQPILEPRAVKGGFTYVWDQDKFNPINNDVVNHIHFEFRDGSKLNRAFTYEWRFWNLVEIRDMLLAAGFSNVTVYWEGADEDGEGNGIFRPRTVVEQEAAYVAYIVAE